jgi:hypothetical protein
VEEGSPAARTAAHQLALDTTHILGRGAVKDTYNLLADGIVEVLRGLAKLVACDLLEVAEEVGCGRYVLGPSVKGQADVDWTDPKARQRFLAEIVADRPPAPLPIRHALHVLNESVDAYIDHARLRRAA